MKTKPAEPADAPVPPSGTEQAVEEQQGQKPKTDATSSVLSDIADVGEVVVDALTLIFD